MLHPNADVRNDEEQQHKLQECLDLLLTSGYFRARIRGLSDFDKLVGGMVWCIKMCRIGVDVNLFYKDSLSIGQKIVVTERIIEVLPSMGCPHGIEPHQIQGMDCIHVFPVLRWLVKQALENQAETTGHNISYAVHLFNKQYTTPCRSTDKPLREVIRKLELLDTRVLASSSSGALPATDSLYLSSESLIMQSPLSQTPATAIVPSMDIDEVKVLQDQLTAVEHQMGEVLESYSNQHSLFEEQTETVRQLQQQLLSITEESDGLNRSLTQKDAERMEEIKSRLEEADVIIKEDKQFKERCRQEYAQMLLEVDQLERSPELSTDTAVLEADMQKRTKRVDILNAELANVSRQIAVIRLQLDDVPGRAEISQYQKRFVELYNLVFSTHKEAKAYYAANNLLADTLSYLQKEQSMLNSISENYTTAKTSPTARTEFLQQLDMIVTSVFSNKHKIVDKKRRERRTLDDLMAQLDKLRCLNRDYHTAVNRFREECAKNEQLSHLCSQNQLAPTESDVAIT